MITDNRKPFPAGTEIQCESGSCFIISGNTVARGGSALVYNAVKQGSDRLFIIKECFPLTDRFSYIRDDNWKIIPAVPDDLGAVWFLEKQKEKFRQENRK